MGIGGNTFLRPLVKNGVTSNEIGQNEVNWKPLKKIVGWLDLQNGSSSLSYQAKIQDATHVFMCDYREDVAKLKAEECRVRIDGDDYEILWIDDPMNLHKHLEIFLKSVGV